MHHTHTQIIDEKCKKFSRWQWSIAMRGNAMHDMNQPNSQERGKLCIGKKLSKSTVQRHSLANAGLAFYNTLIKS